jgi:hypothetical protein
VSLLPFLATFACPCSGISAKQGLFASSPAVLPVQSELLIEDLLSITGLPAEAADAVYNMLVDAGRVG